MPSSYQRLLVWRRSIELYGTVLTLTNALPSAERYRLSDQMLRAAVSIPSNIAEGSSRHSIADIRRFLSIAYGSARELETQIVLVKTYFPVPPDAIEACGIILDHVLRLLSGYYKNPIQRNLPRP